ncbi:MAG: hypothetical protein K2L51_07590 [Clostridiales bacterium]|nr:hypothetical protein [Clostridiales bacterium]
MIVTFIVIIVIASVIGTVVRAKKTEQQRKEEERRKAERHTPNATQKKTVTTPPSKPQPTAAKKSAQGGDPFPAYRADPFAAAQGEKTGTLSPAQYNEWLIDFTLSERTGAKFARHTDRPKFARYLHESGFSHRVLRKTRPHVPQNRLACALPAPKRKPAVTEVAANNDGFVPLPLEKKTARAFADALPQRTAFLPLAAKSAAQARYESYYKGKD